MLGMNIKKNTNLNKNGNSCRLLYILWKNGNSGALIA